MYNEFVLINGKLRQIPFSKFCLDLNRVINVHSLPLDSWANFHKFKVPAVFSGDIYSIFKICKFYNFNSNVFLRTPLAPKFSLNRANPMLGFSFIVKTPKSRISICLSIDHLIIS